MEWITVSFTTSLAVWAAMHRARHANGKTHQLGPFVVRVNPARRGLFRRPRNHTD